MQTDTVARPSNGLEFVVSAVAASLALFAGLRLPWTEAEILWPLTIAQGVLARGLFGTPVLPVQVTLECSGADALALCIAAVLAYPVRWRWRLAGAAGGIVLILALNTLRIGTLGAVAGSPAWFNLMHVYAWPAVLTLAIAGYVFGWMRMADRPPASPPAVRAVPATVAVAAAAWQPSRRFTVLTALFLLVFAAASPIWLESTLVLALGGFIASVSAAVLTIVGVGAQSSGNGIATARGVFLVTQECITTPLIPVYLAAVCCYTASRRMLALGLIATLPLFTLLGIARLLVVAVPPTILASPTFAVHAFYQLLLGAVVVFVAAWWRHGEHRALRHAASGVLAGVLFVIVLGPVYTWAILPASVRALDDPQGAMAFLPAFQVGLYLALWAAAFAGGNRTSAVTGLGVLTLTQVAGFVALHALAVIGFTAHVRDIRAWAVAAPVLIFAAVVTRARAEH